MKKRTQLILLTLLWLTPAWLPAQTNATDRTGSTRRFLFVLETSRAMQRRSEAVLSSVQSLLQSGFQGQIRDGDTLGFWTFNTELYTGRLPLQRWSAAEQREIFNRTLDFVRSQKYEKQGNADLVVAAANHLVESSEIITIILVVSGDAEIRGTAFDDTINSSYRLWRNQQQQARSPFVTVLRGVKGKLTQASTTPALWPVELPPLPPAPAPVVAAPVKKPEPVAPPPMAPPLILSGRKPSASETSKPSEPVPAAAATASATTAAAPASIAFAEAGAAKPTPQPAPIPTSAASPAPPANSPPPAKAEPPPAVAQRPPEAVPARPSASETPATAPTAPPLAASKPTAAAETPAAIPSRPAPPNTAPANAPEEKPVSATPPPISAGPVASAVPPAPSGKSWLGWLGLVFVVAVLAVWGFWRAQRSRRSHVSLITQSLDREQSK